MWCTCRYINSQGKLSFARKIWWYIRILWVALSAMVGLSFLGVWFFSDAAAAVMEVRCAKGVCSDEQKNACVKSVIFGELHTYQTLFSVTFTLKKSSYIELLIWKLNLIYKSNIFLWFLSRHKRTRTNSFRNFLRNDFCWQFTHKRDATQNIRRVRARGCLIFGSFTMHKSHNVLPEFSEGVERFHDSYFIHHRKKMWNCSGVS